MAKIGGMIRQTDLSDLSLGSVMTSHVQQMWRLCEGHGNISSAQTSIIERQVEKISHCGPRQLEDCGDWLGPDSHGWSILPRPSRQSSVSSIVVKNPRETV